MMDQGQNPDFALFGLSDTQHSGEDVGVFCGSLHFQEMLSSMDSLFQQHQDTLESGDSFARSFGKILYVNKLSRRLESLMGSPSPNSLTEFFFLFFLFLFLAGGSKAYIYSIFSLSVDLYSQTGLDYTSNRASF